MCHRRLLSLKFIRPKGLRLAVDADLDLRGSGEAMRYLVTLPSFHSISTVKPPRAEAGDLALGPRLGQRGQ